MLDHAFFVRCTFSLSRAAYLCLFSILLWIFIANSQTGHQADIMYCGGFP